jgi:hypothetical protein
MKVQRRGRLPRSLSTRAVLLALPQNGVADSSYTFFADTLPAQANKLLEILVQAISI